MDTNRLLLEFDEARKAARALEASLVVAWLLRRGREYRHGGADGFADLCEWAAGEIGAGAHRAHEGDR